MLENIDIVKAVHQAMQTEKDARDFYHLGAKYMQDERARKTFELLAREEEQHARWFYEIYPGEEVPDFEAFIAAEPDDDSSWLSETDKLSLSEMNERKAMELAMEKELHLEKNLRALVDKIADEQVRKVFIKNADSTHHHYELIESEYARLMGMVHETDIDTYVRE